MLRADARGDPFFLPGLAHAVVCGMSWMGINPNRHQLLGSQ